MAITPTSVSFTYKKTTSIPPGQLLTHDRLFDSTPTLVTGGLPSYIDFYDITTTSLKVKVNGTNANALAPGTHTESVSIYLYDVDLDKNFFVGSFQLTLIIQDTIVLSVAPNTTNFEFQIGGASPVNKSVAITSALTSPL